MTVQYSKSYVDRVCDSRDCFTIFDLISALDRHRELPQQLKLFLELWTWACSTRSGVWQYYENLSPEKLQAVAQLLDHFQLEELATRYRSGMQTWQEPEYCGDLDGWIDNNWDTIESAAVALVEIDRSCLYPIHSNRDS